MRPSTLKNLALEPEQRTLRSRIVADFFSGSFPPEKPPPFSEEQRGRLVRLADFGARCRPPVLRDRYKKKGGDNVEPVPEAESPGRLAGSLSQLAAVMRAIGTPTTRYGDWLRSRPRGVHPIRCRIIDYLVGPGEAHTASTIAGRTRLKETTVRRHIDDLVALGVLDLVQTRPDQWAASDWLRTGWSSVD